MKATSPRPGAFRTGIVFVLAAIAVASFMVRPAYSQAKSTSGRVGEALREFELLDHRGDSRSLAELRDGGIAAVYFFSGCCRHCEGQLEKWAPLSRRLASSEVRIIGVQYFGERLGCHAQLDKYDLPGTVLADSRGAVCRSLRVRDFTLMTLDEKGVIQYRGGLDEAAVKKSLGIEE